MNKLRILVGAITVGWMIGGAIACFDDEKQGKGPRNRNDKQAIHAAGEAGGQAAGHHPGGNFDPTAFSASMIQQFDQDGNGELNQSELANCLGMLHQQVLQQQQAMMQNVQQRSSNGPPMKNGGPFGNMSRQQNGSSMTSRDSDFAAAQAQAIDRAGGRSRKVIQGGTNGARTGGRGGQ